MAGNTIVKQKATPAECFKGRGYYNYLTMFFRHERPKVLSFEDHLAKARAEGFSVSSTSGGTRIERKGIACVVRPGEQDVPKITERPGVVMGDEIGHLRMVDSRSFSVHRTAK